VYNELQVMGNGRAVALSLPQPSAQSTLRLLL